MMYDIMIFVCELIFGVTPDPRGVLVDKKLYLGLIVQSPGLHLKSLTSWQFSSIYVHEYNELSLCMPPTQLGGRLMMVVWEIS